MEISGVAPPRHSNPVVKSQPMHPDFSQSMKKPESLIGGTGFKSSLVAGTSVSSQQRFSQAESAPSSHECEAHHLDPATANSLLQGESASSVESMHCDDGSSPAAMAAAAALKPPNLADLQLNSRPGSSGPSSPVKQSPSYARGGGPSRTSSMLCPPSPGGSPSWGGGGAGTPTAPPTTPKKRTDEHLDALFDAHYEDSLAKRAMRRAANAAGHHHFVHHSPHQQAPSPLAAAAAAAAMMMPHHHLLLQQQQQSAAVRGSVPTSWPSSPTQAMGMMMSPTGLGADSLLGAFQGVSQQPVNHHSVRRPAITTSLSAALGASPLMRQQMPLQQHQFSLPQQPVQPPAQHPQLTHFMETLLKRSLSGPGLPPSSTANNQNMLGVGAGECPRVSCPDALMPCKGLSIP